MDRLRILHLEDDPLDAELIAVRLRDGGIDAEITLAASRAEFERALVRCHDLILADYSVPGFDGIVALGLAQAACPDVPFIFLSGALGEEVAIDTLKRGATDYVLKQRLDRIVPAVRRALREAEERAARRRAETAVRQSEERLHAALTAGRAVAWEWDLGAGRVLRSDNAPDMFGLPQESSSAEDSFFAAVHPDDAEHVRGAIEAALRSGSSYTAEFRIVRPDGRILWMLDQARVERDAAGRAVRMSGLIRDITPRKHAEEALRESERRNRATFNTPAAGICETDPDGRFIRVNAAYCQLTGYTREELLELRFEQVTHPDDLKEDLRHYLRLRAGETDNYTIEKRCIRKDGGVIWVSRSVSMVRDERGRARYAISVVSDITPRKHAEEVMRESEQRFRSLAESAPVLIWVTDETGAFTYINRRFAEFVGRDADAVCANGWAGVGLYPEDAGAVINTFQIALRSRHDFRVQFRLRRSDGAWRWMIGTGVPRKAYDAAFAGFVGTLVDVTEIEEAREQVARHRDRLEELVTERTAQLETSHQRLRLAERLASIGTLATGLGHDMGNLLLPIRCRLDAMQARPLPPGFAEDIEAIRQSAEYLQQLTNGLRLLALDPSEGQGAGGVTDLGAWWPDIAALLKNALPKRVKLERHIPSGLPPVAIAPHRLTQAVLNLVNNAGDALRERRAGNVIVWAEPAGKGRVRIGVTDDGPGMPPEIAQRALEPFFTTKTRGLSTGLGLSLVHGIVQASGGSLDIRSTQGEGATIILTLPLAESRAGREQAGGSKAVAVTLRDARMQAYVTALVGSLGFTPERATPGEPGEASIWITEPHPAALDAAERFLAGDPARRIILVGGPASEWERLGATVLEANAGPGAIRDAIQNVAGALDGRAGRAASGAGM